MTQLVVSKIKDFDMKPRTKKIILESVIDRPWNGKYGKSAFRHKAQNNSATFECFFPNSTGDHSYLNHSLSYL